MPGRKGVDNAIVVQEIIHTLSMKKGRVGYMAIKVDLKKAYDKMEWSFIREMLINANLPHNLISLIMSCVSSVSTSILFNGGNKEPILLSRGIRQGDPLSPYLFILCMEVLGHLIEEKFREISGTLLRALIMGLQSHIFSLRMTWFPLQKLTMVIVQRSGMCLIVFVLDPSSLLVKANQGFIFLRILMWISVWMAPSKGSLSVISLARSPPMRVSITIRMAGS